MKKLFITAIVIMCCISAAVLGASSAFCTMDDEGYAMPAEAGIAQSLAGDGSGPVSLVEVRYDDIIYSSLSGYYVGENRKKIDLTYPLYTNGGTGLRFLSDENWLVTTEADLYQTFDGLYVREGLSYNADMTQADEGEFIMLALSNGLYMNAQQAVFTNPLGKTVIPAGSILSMDESAICWYEQKNGTLGYCSEEAVFNATISFGSHTYGYLDLLDALGLIRDAIKDADHGRPDPEKLQEAEEILNGKGDSGAKKPGTSDSTVHDKPDSDAGDGTSEFGGGDDNGYNGEGTPDNTHNGSSEAGDKPNEGNNPSGGGTSESNGTSGSGGTSDSISGGGISGGGTSGSGGISGGGSSGGGSSGGGIPGGGSSGSGSSGGSGISSGGSGSSGSGENQGEAGETEPGEGETGGESQPIPYQDPVVTLNNIQPWSYALGLDMKIDDPSGAILRGVSFSVYKSIKGSGGTETNDMGFTVYPSSRYEGKSAMLRKNKTGGSQSFALSPLQPGQKVYLQYNFRYNAEETDETTGVKRIVRKYYYSNLIEITIPTVEQGDVKTVSADWTVDYAALSNALKLNNLTLANTSGYDPTAETYQFENFKLNTLPYVNRLELKLTPEGGGTPTTIVVGSSTLSRAQKEGGTSFVSSSPKLGSNTRYTCEVTAKDRYGNVLPLDAANGQSQAIYTSKETPVVTITEKENVTDSLTLGIRVSDPDGALKQGQSLRFQVRESRTGTAAELYGTWDTTKISAGGNGVSELELKNPHDGCEYELKLDSLAFSCLYSAEVYGDYSPQPDNVAEGEGMVLAPVTDEMLGTLTVYTAPIASGLVAFNTGVTDLMDTSVTMNATMTSDTTLDILPLIDEFRITLKDKSGNVVNTTVLSQDVLAEGSDYTYDTDKAAVILQNGDYINPQVMLYGTRDKYSSDPWYSFLIHEVVQDPENGIEGGYSKPMQLKIAMPSGSLSHFTEYNFTIQAVVKKSGQEYLIPVSMTNNSFTTKKTLPVVQYKDLFLAADVAEFLDLKIYDPDGTILNDGAVAVQLYYGNTLLKAENITADRNGSAEGIDLRFDGLIEGGEYTLKFVAAAYNDAEGYGSYQTNYVLETFNLVGGSALYGKLNLLNLGKNGGGTGENLVDFNHYYEGYINTNSKFPVNNQNYRSYYIPCEPDTDYYITAPSFGDVFRVAWTSQDLPESQTTTQQTLSGYKAITTINKKMVFHTGADARYMVVSVGSLSAASPELIRQQLTVRKYDGSLVNGEFAARINVTAMDKVGYLGREGENAEVTLTIERSDSMELPEYSFYNEIRLSLTENSDGTLSLDIIQELTGLTAGDGWRATLMTTYQGSQVLLDQITFRTDVDYVTVATHAQLISALNANSYANILVTSDFVQDQNRSMSVNGTIDFQGHVVTKGENITTFFFFSYGKSHIYNLVYDYPNQPYYVNPAAIFYVADGTIENLIVRTYGQVEIQKESASLIGLSLRQTGVLRNFIVRAGGDLIGNTSGDGIGVIASGVHGVMENGYIYGVNGAGMVARGYAGSVGFFSKIYSDGKVRNMYILMDSWYQNGLSAALISPTNFSKKTFSDIYTVGDFYTVGAGEGKNYLLPLASLKSVSSSAKKIAIENVWTLTSREYANSSFVHHGEISRLYDQAWQKSILKNGFDVEGCVSVGFYPRLQLPTEMQKYQEYIPLPVMGQDTAPKLAGDSWADEAPYDSHDLDSGYIKLRFRNSGNLKIDSVSIKGLITEVMDQKAAADGLYDVILNVQVDPAAPEYVSKYQVTDFTYTSGTVRRTVKTDYQTAGIDFWKAVASPSDWAAINDRMDWNYKLTQDIDFSNSGLSPGEITINGSKASFSATKKFTGCLDGQEHVLAGIRLENISYPHVILNVTDGEIRNLLVEDMVITSSRVLSSNCGFIGGANNSVIRNVRFRNCSLSGGGNMGIMVGSASASTLEQCSVTDSLLTDIGIDKPLYAGGLAGTGGSCHIRECYTRDMTIEITRTNVVNAIGGLTGYAGSNSTEGCYTHGSIEASGSYVGGINGAVTTGDATYMRKCWSYVKILQKSGDYAAGLSAHGNYIDFSIALGDVAGAGENADRVCAKKFGSAIGTTVYAYQGQIAGQLAENEKGNAVGGLLSGEELGRSDIWQDIIRLGDSWDYSPVTRGCVPLLTTDCSREGWQQEDIPLPGQNDDPVLRVEEAQYENGKFNLTARLEHPGIESTAIRSNLQISLDGMDLSDAAVQDGKTQINVEPRDNQSTLISIITKDFTKALDSYALNLRYTEPGGRERDLTALVKYLETDGSVHQVWWEIPDLGRWNEIMSEHGKTGENIMITGRVDFGGGSTAYNELEINRLQGSGDNSGFYNLVYKGGAAGRPWITKIGLNMKDLTFTNMKFDFTETETSRSMTGAILSISNAENLKLEDIHMISNQYSRSYFGFISVSSGIISNVEMKGITIEDIQKTVGTVKEYCGALAAYSTGDIHHVTASEVRIDAPKNNRTGGILGALKTYGQLFYNCSIESFNVEGYSYVGGLLGESFSNNSMDDSAKNGTVKGASSVGGLFGSSSTTGSIATMTDWRVEGVAVTATSGSSGGVAGNAFHIHTDRAVVKDCTIQGTTFVGGIVGGGGTSGNKTIRDLQVTGCTIQNNRTSLAGASWSSNCTGGVFSTLSTTQAVNIQGAAVRDCTITGPGYVGGLMGSLSRKVTGVVTDRVYVAEDVTVSAKESVAGGFIGYADYLTLTNSACGAAVSAGNNEAGGIIGHVEPQNDTLMGKLEKVYYKGSVSAGADYAGGIIGKLNSGVLKITDDSMKGVLVAADVRTNGENSSLWINDIVQTGDAGTGLIYICEESTLNGQTAKSLVDMAEASEQTQYVIPKRTDNIQLLIPSSDFAAETLYKTTLGFDDNKWDFSGLDTYMPYTRDYAGTAVLQCVNHNSAGEAAGILVPDGGALGLETVVYASGVNTVNIETIVPEGADYATINVNNQAYETDANGVVTLYYDYKTDFKVGDTTYSGASLSRKVMTYGDYWYYIDSDGNVHYGKATGVASEMQDAGEVTGITNAIHLWQGYAMDGSGNIYELNGGTAANATDSFGTGNNLDKLENARAFWQDGSTQVYYYFTMYQGNRIPYRVFLLDGTAYTVSPAQNTVYDGVVLSSKTEFGVISRYFALLNAKNGELSAYLSNMKLGDITNSEIQYISNNMGYNGTVMLAYYEGGNVVGVDYTTGETVCDTFPPVQSFALYARRTIMNLGLLGGSNILTSDGSFYDGENLRDTLTENGQYESDGTAPITDGGNGEGGNTITGGTAGDNTQSGSNTASGSNALNGSNTGGGSQMADGDSIANGSANIPGGTVPDGSAASEGVNNGDGSGEDAGDAADSDAAGHVAGGTGEAGLSGGTDGAMKGASEGTLKDGSTASADDASAENAEISSRFMATEAALKELFGTSVIAYSDKTEQYELLDTASLAAGQQIERVDALAQKNYAGMADDADSDYLDADAEKKGENHFSIAWGLNRNLYADEKQGFLLIALAAAAAVAVLFILYWKVIRRRKSS